jgi:hypothetical protein
MPEITINLSEKSMIGASTVVARKGLSLSEALSLEVDRIAAENTFDIPQIQNYFQQTLHD